MINVFILNIGLNYIQINCYIIDPLSHMKFEIRIIANNIKQRIPSILIEGNRVKYIINMPEQNMRFWYKYNFKISEGTKIFFTRENSQSMSNLVEFFQEVYHRYKCGINFYLGHKGFSLVKQIQLIIGHKMLALSCYNLQSNQLMLGAKNFHQLFDLYTYNQQKFFFSNFSNQEMLKVLKNPCNPSQNILQKNNILNNNQSLSQIRNYYKDQIMQIHPFEIKSEGDEAKRKIFCNFICLLDPKKQNHVNLDKLKIYKQKNKLKDEQVQQIFKAGYLKLASGLQIKLEDLPFDDYKNYNFVILHYESENDIKLILNHPSLKTYLEEVKAGTFETNSVIHIMEDSGDLILSQQFRKLRQAFGSDVKHVVYNQSCRHFPNEQCLKAELLHYESLRFVTVANQYVGSFMPKIVQNIVESYRKGYYKMINYASLTTSKQEGFLVPYKYNFLLKIAPHRKQGYKRIDLSSGEPLDMNLNDRDIQALEQELEQKDEVRQGIKKKLEDLTKYFNPTVIFLGTSAKNSIFIRNSSGIMVKIPQKNQNLKQFSILMDCGEGTYSQMINHFGIESSQKQLINLKVLFITHKHQDHFGGIFMLLAKRNSLILQRVQEKERKNHKIFLIIPYNLIRWFHTFNQNLQKVGEYCQVIFHQSLTKTKKTEQNSPKVFVFKNKKTVESEIKQNSQKQKQKIFLFKNQNNQKVETKQDQKGEIKYTLSQKKLKYEQFLKIMRKNNQDKCSLSNQLEEVRGQRQAIYYEILQKYRSIEEDSLKRFKNFLQSYGITKFIPVPVIHCKQSYGIVIEHESGVKISYSGDCRPTYHFEKMAKKSTLLIHEATFKEYQQKTAIISKHSTQKQAIQIGQKSDSLITVLTHFSKLQHNKQLIHNKGLNIANEPKEQSTYEQYNVCYAVDHLQFKLSDMHELSKISDILKQKRIITNKANTDK